MRFTLRKDGEDRGWPGHLFWGRMRTSTFVLIVAFFGAWWLFNTYKPAPPPPVPETQVVPPGFVPDPAYTWVPRTYVQERPRTTTPTTTTTTETSPTETTSTTPTSPEGPVPTTLVDPDGPGPLPPTPVSATTSTAPTTPTSPTTSPVDTPLPVPNRSGTPTTSTTATVVPGAMPPPPA